MNRVVFRAVGLCQTREYAAALLGRIVAFRKVPDDVERAVAARIDRQRVLTEGGHRFSIVVEEAVLRYQMGIRDIMIGQLEHLVTVATLPSVSLGVIPFSAPQRRIWALEGFSMFDDRRVHVELLSARVVVTQPREVAVYANAFSQLAGIAVYGAAARARIRAAVDELRAG
jgi:hypothetical protein